jgi:hypothetical protein
MRGELRLEFSRCDWLLVINSVIALFCIGSLFYLPLPYWVMAFLALAIFFCGNHYLAQFSSCGELIIDVEGQTWYLDGRQVHLCKATVWPWLVALQFSGGGREQARLVLCGNCDPQALRRLRVLLNLTAQARAKVS